VTFFFFSLFIHLFLKSEVAVNSRPLPELQAAALDTCYDFVPVMSLLQIATENSWKALRAWFVNVSLVPSLLLECIHAVYNLDQSVLLPVGRTLYKCESIFK
jgi:hypothetical protein